jgi:MFS family permease
MTDNPKSGFAPGTLVLMSAAAGILMITMGMRQSLGLYMGPIIQSTHVGYAGLSFALGIGQLMWGVTQPIFGAMADRHGASRVLLIGALLIFGGAVLTPFATTEFQLIMTLGVLTAAGAGAGSFSVMIGVVAQRVSAQERSFAAGFVNAGGSLGQFVFAALNGFLIATFGWMTAMWTMAVTVLATIPLTRPLLRKPPGAALAPAGAPAPPANTMTLREQLRIAARDPGYWCLQAGFFTCGFHIAFLTTHLPGEVALCNLPRSVGSWSLAIIGLSNVVGSLVSGWAGNVMRMKWLLFIMYFSRAVAIAVYLMMPKTSATFYLFAVVLGLTWLATVPPTAGLIGKLFGVRYLATLFGFTLLNHQIGAFFGATIGGKVLAAFGDFSWMWYADIALALFAAFINLPIREAKVGTFLVSAPQADKSGGAF